jgi:hypothetical protein
MATQDTTISTVSELASTSLLGSSSDSEASATQIGHNSLKRRRKITAECWKYFRDPLPGEVTQLHGRRAHYCITGSCKKINPPHAEYTTTNATSHLKTHGINLGSKDSKVKKAVDTTIEALLRNSGQKQVQKQLTCELFTEAVITLIINNNLPLNCVEWPEFHALIRLLNPLAETFLPESHSTIPRMVDSSFNTCQEALKGELAESQSIVHLSADLWSSTTRRAYLAIIAHWVSKSGLQKALLRLPRVLYSHSGEAQARHIWETLEFYNIAGKLGYITTDNASANGTMVQEISRIY